MELLLLFDKWLITYPRWVRVALVLAGTIWLIVAGLLVLCAPVSSISGAQSMLSKFQQYPQWVQQCMFGVLAVLAILYIILKIFAPPKKLKLNHFRQGFIQKKNDRLSLEVMVTNNTGEMVSLSEANLVYYRDKVSYSGLQSHQGISAEYVISRSGDHNYVTMGDGYRNRVNVQLIKPFAGQEQLEARVPIQQTVKNGKSDRFMLVLSDATKLDKRINMAQITLCYGDNMTIDAETDIDLN